MLSPEDMQGLVPAETARFRSPIPTQSVSSDEFLPAAQTPRQRECEVRLQAIGSALARKHGTGAPQWQIEALRRLEIPEEMQRKYGFAPLGAADGPVKTAIFGGNSARLYHFTRQQQLSLRDDAVSVARAQYDLHGEGRTNLRYGYMQARVG